MNCTQYTEAIHELADGTLGPVRRAELQTHLDQCDACRALALDLQKIRRAAESLDPVAPPPHVWLQIASELRKTGQVTDVSPSRSHLALLAIAATLLLAVGGSLYLLLPHSGQPAPSVASGPATPNADAGSSGPSAGNAPAVDPVQSVGDEFRLAEQHLQAGITKLQEAAKDDPNAIDPQTAATLQKNLEIIDQAISESRAALNSEPQSAPARDSLFEALRQKVTLLQNTIALMNEMRKGNSAGAAQILEGGNKS